MKIRFEDIPEDGLQISFSGKEALVDKAWLSETAPPGVGIDPRMKGDIQLLKDRGDVFLIGWVQTTVRLQCARCLEDFQVDRRVDMNLAVTPGALETELAEPDADTGEIDRCFVEEGELDLGRVFTQEILLSLPMKPLCKEDCPGLCAQCGALAGSPECRCPQDEPVDSRWGALKKLKDELPP